MSSNDIVYRERTARGEAAGLVVLLHGVGANEDSLMPLAEELPAELHVILARSPIALGPSAYGFFEVRFGAQGPVINPQQAEQSRITMTAFVQAQQERLDISTDKTLVAGFSQGGIMSASIALTAPASVNGFGIFSGRILPEIEPHIPRDIADYDLDALVTHGHADSKLPFALAERSDTVLTQLGVAHSLKGYQCDHGLIPPMIEDITAWVRQRLLP